MSAFTGSSGTVNELGNSTINNNFGSGSLIGTTGFPLENVSAPMAFLNVMFLPEDEVIDLEKDVTFAYDQIDAGATQALGEPKNTNYDQLRIDNFVAPSQGYVLVYLSNESNTLTEVYFDDLTLELSQHNVTQTDDYYPFGLAFNEYRRPELDKNEYLYQGKEELEGTDWYDFHARNYHAALGRFMSVDPVFNGPSGYVGMLNNPASTIDPSGEEPLSITTALIIAATVSATSYTASIALSDGGFNNWDWGQFGKSVFIGTASGAVTFGIGTYFKDAVELGRMAQTLADVSRIATHATFQGGLSAAQGGDFWTAFGSAVVGGAVGLGTRGWDPGFGREATTIGSAMLLGGTVAELQQDGEFWRGAAVAGIVAGANDVAHRIGDNLEQRIADRKALQFGGDPNFRYYDEKYEFFAYKRMLAQQKLDGVEYAAYLVSDTETAKRGVLILPADGNRVDYSRPFVGFNGQRTLILDRYKPLLSVHTHPFDDFTPSFNDINTIKQLNIPGIILTDSYYRIINTQQHPLHQGMSSGFSNDLTSGYESLFELVK